MNFILLASLVIAAPMISVPLHAKVSVSRVPNGQTIKSIRPAGKTILRAATTAPSTNVEKTVQKKVSPEVTEAIANAENVMSKIHHDEHARAQSSVKAAILKAEAQIERIQETLAKASQ